MTRFPVFVAIATLRRIMRSSPRTRRLHKLAVYIEIAARTGAPFDPADEGGVWSDGCGWVYLSQPALAKAADITGAGAGAALVWLVAEGLVLEHPTLPGVYAVAGGGDR